MTLLEGSLLLRARYQKPGETLKTPQQLGPPPFERAIQTNRMSPPGIVMFYASDDPKTALHETVTGPGTFVIGQFETLRPDVILDLAGVPPVPSLFQAIPDSLEYSPRQVIGFLAHVSREMSRLIARDDRVHIEYVPTQVVTEYVRFRPTRENAKVDGIKYPSSTNPGHVSYVFFATQENLFLEVNESESSLSSNEDRWLKLLGFSSRTVTSERFDVWDA